jgi:hypothetical protein
MKMKLPDIWAVCEWCFDNDVEVSGYAPDDVAWGPRSGKWLCLECWAEMENVGEDQDVTPLVYADAVIVPIKEQMQRLIAASAKRRLGVK